MGEDDHIPLEGLHMDLATDVLEILGIHMKLGLIMIALDKNNLSVEMGYDIFESPSRALHDDVSNVVYLITWINCFIPSSNHVFIHIMDIIETWTNEVPLAIGEIQDVGVMEVLV